MAVMRLIVAFMSVFAVNEKTARCISSTETRLAEYLLNSTRYSPEVRPVHKYTDKVVVRHGLTLAQLIKLDEKSQIITTRVLLTMKWNDVHLIWDPKHYDGITEFNVDVKLIWVPQIELFNNADDSLDSIAVPRAIVKSNGSVTAVFPRILKSTCIIHVKDFPFDQQMCELRFGSFQFDTTQMDVERLSEKVVFYTGMTKYQENGEWVLGATSVVYGRVFHAFSNTTEFAQMSYKLILRRKPRYYVANFLIPCVLIALITILLFLIPADTGEQMAVGVTILLSMAVFFLLLEGRMPETSDHVPLIGKYFACTIVQISLAVGATCMMLCFHHHEATELPVWMKKYVLVKLATLLRIKTSENEVQNASKRGAGFKKSNRSARRTDNFAVEVSRSHLLIWQAKAKAKRLRREKAAKEELSRDTLVTNLSDELGQDVPKSLQNAGKEDRQREARKSKRQPRRQHASSKDAKKSGSKKTEPEAKDQTQKKGESNIETKMEPMKNRSTESDKKSERKGRRDRRKKETDEKSERKKAQDGSVGGETDGTRKENRKQKRRSEESVKEESELKKQKKGKDEGRNEKNKGTHDNAAKEQRKKEKKMDKRENEDEAEKTKVKESKKIEARKEGRETGSEQNKEKGTNKEKEGARKESNDDDNKEKGKAREGCVKEKKKESVKGKSTKSLTEKERNKTRSEKSKEEESANGLQRESKEAKEEKRKQREGGVKEEEKREIKAELTNIETGKERNKTRSEKSKEEESANGLQRESKEAKEEKGKQREGGVKEEEKREIKAELTNIETGKERNETGSEKSKEKESTKEAALESKEDDNKEQIMEREEGSRRIKGTISKEEVGGGTNSKAVKEPTKERRDVGKELDDNLNAKQVKRRESSLKRQEGSERSGNQDPTEKNTSVNEEGKDKETITKITKGETKKIPGSEVEKGHGVTREKSNGKKQGEGNSNSVKVGKWVRLKDQTTETAEEKLVAKCSPRELKSRRGTEKTDGNENNLGTEIELDSVSADNVDMSDEVAEYQIETAPQRLQGEESFVSKTGTAKEEMSAHETKGKKTKGEKKQIAEEIEAKQAYVRNDSITQLEVCPDIGSSCSVRSGDDDTRILIPSPRQPSTVLRRNATKQFKLVDRVVRIKESLTQKLNKGKATNKQEGETPSQPTALQRSAKKLGNATDWEEAEHESVKLMAHTIQQTEEADHLKMKWKEVGKVMNNLLMWLYITSIILTFFIFFGPVFMADEMEIK